MLPQVLKNTSYLNYRNDDVLSYFSCLYNLPAEEIEEVFQETKKIYRNLYTARNIHQ